MTRTPNENARFSEAKKSKKKAKIRDERTRWKELFHNGMDIALSPCKESSDGGKTASLRKTFGWHVGVIADGGIGAIRGICRFDSSEI
jgi:hypothetical protein